MAKVIMFPEEILALNEEIMYHKDVQELLNQQPAGEFEIRLAAVAAHLGIVIDGTYSEEDLRHLADICRKKLVEKRTLIVLS